MIKLLELDYQIIGLLVGIDKENNFSSFGKGMRMWN